MAPTRRSIWPNASVAGMPAASRWRRYSTPVATATARASTSVAPASCSTRASTVMARQPSRWAHSRTRSASGARSGVVPSRAAAPNGSRPRLPPTDSRSATRSSRARAAPGWSVTDETTTGARSRRTSASTSGRSATAMPSSPRCTHTEVTPCSRSSSTAARVTAGSGSSCSWRTSHGVVASRRARPRVNGIAPGTPRSRSSRR